MNLGRLARTVARLHPLQIAARGPNALLARIVRSVPTARPPRVRETWPTPSDSLRQLAEAERSRGAERLARLPAGRLREYESCYGLALGAGRQGAHGEWSSRTAMEPYPASVRARRIAVAIRFGRRDLEPELARAARAVLVRPELHLLGNHLLENGIALACAGAAAQGQEADLWWSAGVRLLAWQLPAQFLEDGGHVERSASYHVALTAGLLEAIELADASGRGAPALWREVASRALGWMKAVRAPDGTYPLFNDAALDAAPGLDDVLALGVATAPVGRSDVSADARTTHLDATGWIRADVNDASLFLDAGPDADGWQPGHAHADGLTFELWVAGVRTIVDFGVARYEPGAARDETRATRSHNTVELGGVDSCEVWGAFRVGRRGRGRVISCSTHHGPARIELEHDGYAWRPGSPSHQRSIGLSPNRLEIRDRVVGGGGEPWISRLRLDAAAGSRVRVSGSGEVLRREDRWYPRHGEARPALVLEQRGASGGAGEVVWRIDW